MLVNIVTRFLFSEFEKGNKYFIKINLDKNVLY